jgi:hypothetical protein
MFLCNWQLGNIIESNLMLETYNINGSSYFAPTYTAHARYSKYLTKAEMQVATGIW